MVLLCAAALPFLGVLGGVPSLLAAEADQTSIIAPGDPIAGLKQTVNGKPNMLATSGDFGGNDGNDELPPAAIDGDTNNKYLNKAQDGDNAPGVNSGFVVTPKNVAVVTAIQFASANDMEDRDPIAITVEGSNDPGAMEAGAADFTLIYKGRSGLETDPGRNAWGKTMPIDNRTAYKTYRILVTASRAPSDSTQYAEVKLIDNSADANHKSIVAPGDPIAGLKRTVKGTANMLATSGDFGGIDGNDELPSAAIDGESHTKYVNIAPDGANAPGVNSGFVVTPKAGASVVTALQFASANDMEDRDPVTITVEGSNDPKAMEAGATDFTLLYEGPSGLETDRGRKAWGKTIAFDNKAAYKSYRVLVTATRGTTDSTQYAEVKLIANSANATTLP